MAFLKRHPVVSLLLLTPGIPEYLSGSSPFSSIVLNPVMFALQLVANLGLYGPGVLLVREAMIRWKKGWGTVLLLGAAYGILEEGVALSTLFDAAAKPVGEFGVYGHWLGVNWVWLGGIIPVHMIYSISLPILLLGMALPRTKGQPFLTGPKLPAALAVLIVDVSGLFLFVLLVTKFWMGWPVLAGSLVSIAVLVLSARRVGPAVLGQRHIYSKAGPGRMALVGLVFFPSVLVSESVVRAAGAPPVLDFLWIVVLQAAFLTYVLRTVGSGANGRVVVALAVGLVLPIAAIGLLAQFSFPLVLFPDLLMTLFFRKLWSACHGVVLTNGRVPTTRGDLSTLDTTGRHMRARCHVPAPVARH